MDMDDPQVAERETWFSKDDYIAALRQSEPQLTPKHRAMLKAHAEAPDQVLDVFDLAAAAQSQIDNATYSIYGRLGHLLARALEQGEDFDDQAHVVWTRHIGEDFRPKAGDAVYWKMHPELAEALLDIGWANPRQIDDPLRDIAEAQAELELEPETVRRAIVLSRIGQGQFRERLLQYWGSCAVTGVTVREALRASHIKPWSRSSNLERLHMYNGLLLTGTLDLLFDAGLISFNEVGQMLITPALSVKDQQALGLIPEMKLRQVEQAHQP